MNGHVTPPAIIMAICKELAHELLECESPLLEHACFAILREHDVVGS
jgi:hypothetical protein